MNYNITSIAEQPKFGPNKEYLDKLVCKRVITPVKKLGEIVEDDIILDAVYGNENDPSGFVIYKVYKLLTKENLSNPTPKSDYIIFYTIANSELNWGYSASVFTPCSERTQRISISPYSLNKSSLENAIIITMGGINTGGIYKLLNPPKRINRLDLVECLKV